MLTEREFEIAECIASGYDNSEIAKELYISPSTVRWYLDRICFKLDIKGAVRRTKIAIWYLTKRELA